MSPTVIGIMSTAGTMFAALVGAFVMLLLSRRAEKRAQAAEERAREADRLDAAMAQWEGFTAALLADITRLTAERDAERVRADRATARAETLWKARLNEQG